MVNVCELGQLNAAGALATGLGCKQFDAVISDMIMPGDMDGLSLEMKPDTRISLNGTSSRARTEDPLIKSQML